MVVKVECEVMEVVHDSDAAVLCRIEPASVALQDRLRTLGLPHCRLQHNFAFFLTAPSGNCCTRPTYYRCTSVLYSTLLARIQYMYSEIQGSAQTN